MGPLAGVTIVELAGLGPAPFCCMLLADMGADVIRVDRAAGVDQADTAFRYNLRTRSRRSIAVDLKSPGGVDVVLRLIDRADALVEGFRPGVMERLGLGPETCLARNGRLVYGRATGWGQDGPLSASAGHDINYISLSGVLDAIGPAGCPPVPPLNLIGDYGGGALYLAVGLLAGIVHARAGGQGQVVDSAMSDGAASLMTMMFGALAQGRWVEERGSNLNDGGAHFYNVYETSDGAYISVGSIEPQFYELLLEHTGIDAATLPPQHDRARWPEAKAILATAFKAKTRAEWTEVLAGTDACFAPVLRMSEAFDHPQNLARGTFVDVDGIRQPAPAPRFSVTPSAVIRPPVRPGTHTREVLLEWGFSPDEVGELSKAGAIATCDDPA